MKSFALSTLIAAAAAQNIKIFTYQENLIEGNFGEAFALQQCQATGGADYIALIATTATAVADKLNALPAIKIRNHNDNVLIADSPADFLGLSAGAEDITDYASAASPFFVWTGSDRNGNTVQTCSLWTSNQDTSTGAVGRPATGSNYLNEGVFNCDNNLASGWYCIATVPTSSGNLDPHFYGFNGEKIDIEHDESSADRVFSVFCTEDMEFNTLFSSTAEGLLYMTQFWVRIQDVKVSIELGQAPVVVAGEYERSFISESNRTSLVFDNAHVEYLGAKTFIVTEGLRINIAEASLNNDKFLNFDIMSTNFERYPAGGLVGRTMAGALSAEEFGEYKQYQLAASTQYFDTVCQM